MKVKLKDVASFSKGQQINGDNLLSSAKYAYLNGGTSPSGYWNEYNIPANSIAISEGGNSCGYVNYMQTPFWCGAHCYYLFDLKISNTKYLYYALKARQEEIMKLRSGACMPNIKKSDLAEFVFEFDFDDNHQTVIVAQLEGIERMITLRKQQLSKLDELVKSRFIELFGDGRDGKTPVKMLGSLCKFQQGTQIPVDEQFEEQKTGYKRFLRIIDYTQAPQPPRYVNVNGKEVDEKSVVIVRYGATAGFVGRGYQGILANNLFEIMPDETILSKDFLFLALKYGTFEKEVHDKAFGAAMPALSFSMMNDISVVVPMEEQQQQFASFVEQIDKSKFEIQQSLEKLETLKKALMQKYFG